MKQSRVLIGTGYGLAVLLVVLPLLANVVPLLPARPGDIPWRLQAFGALSQALVLPLAGLLVAIGTGVLLGHRRVVRGLSLLGYASSLLLTAGAGLFALDFFQYGGAVGADLREYYQVAGIVYFTAFGLSAAFLIWVGAAAWRVSKASRRDRRRVAASGPGVLAPKPPAR